MRVFNSMQHSLICITACGLSLSCISQTAVGIVGTNLLARCPLCYSTISVTVLIALHISGMQIGRAW